MNLQDFRRDCENRNNTDEQVKAIIMRALRDEKITPDMREDFLSILEELRPNVHAVVMRSKKRHDLRHF